MSHLRILLVDDHKMVRDGIRLILQAQKSWPVKVDEAADGDQAFYLAKSFLYDVIVLDINMPGMDGVETAHKILSYTQNKHILALTMYDEDTYISKMVETGVLGYILKNSGAEQLIEATKKVAKGEKYFSSDVAIKLMEPSHHDELVEKKNEELYLHAAITDRQLEVLKGIANELTSIEIAKMMNVSRKTVDTHRMNLMKRLGVKNTAGLIRYALENNLI